MGGSQHLGVRLARPNQGHQCGPGVFLCPAFVAGERDATLPGLAGVVSLASSFFLVPGGGQWWPSSQRARGAPPPDGLGAFPDLCSKTQGPHGRGGETRCQVGLHACLPSAPMATEPWLWASGRHNSDSELLSLGEKQGRVGCRSLCILCLPSTPVPAGNLSPLPP
jgi:hypothetical protein